MSPRVSPGSLGLMGPRDPEKQPIDTLAPPVAISEQMKATFKILTALHVLAAACSGGPPVSKDEAARAAEDAVGGEAGEVERAVEGDFDVWEVYVAMDNGATVEVKVDVETGDIVVVEDKAGPFDYADFTPVEGVLSYAAITARALEQQSGAVEAWEYKRELEAGEVEHEYEFYVRAADGQLWEIKFDATDGTATDIEAKDMVDP